MDEKPALKGNMLLDYSGAKKLWAWSQLKHSCSTSVTENATHGSTSDLEQEKTCLSRGRLPKLKQCISIVRCTEQVKTEQLHSLLGTRALIKGHAMLQVLPPSVVLPFISTNLSSVVCRCPPCPSGSPSFVYNALLSQCEITKQPSGVLYWDICISHPLLSWDQGYTHPLWLHPSPCSSDL